jgi:hypothetical protein
LALTTNSKQDKIVLSQTPIITDSTMLGDLAAMEVVRLPSKVKVEMSTSKSTIKETAAHINIGLLSMVGIIPDQGLPEEMVLKFAIHSSHLLI